MTDQEKKGACLHPFTVNDGQLVTCSMCGFPIRLCRPTFNELRYLAWKRGNAYTALIETEKVV